ncbi:acyltransferase family protein [Paenibacillus turpanensis]|uniref:acyltransferase family protein n=1 Tax=Paenibacillus turpanensis TaxID=2689078 RepID=UPI001407E066|nr:hypothetical protein [Paenibacillus turpanensis]
MHTIDTKEQETFVHHLKIALILFVVTANMIEPLIGEGELTRALYQWIYTFHIPAFAFAAGACSRSFRWNLAGTMTLANGAFQFILFQTLYVLADSQLFHAPGAIYSLAVPYGLLWFLMSQWFWRAMLPLFRKLRYPVAAAMLLGLAVGAIPAEGFWLSFSRTFIYFPFFLLGERFFTANYVKIITSKYRKWAAGFVWLLVFAAFLQYGQPLRQAWLLGNATWTELGVTWMEGLSIRTALYGLQFAMTFALLALLPRTTYRFSEAGARTVYVYLLHGFIVKLLVVMGWWNWPGINEGVALAAALLFTAFLTLLLIHPRVKAALHWFVEPVLPLDKPLSKAGKRLFAGHNGR